MSLSKWLAGWRYVSYIVQVAPFSKGHSSKQIWQVKRSFASCPRGSHNSSKQTSEENSLTIHGNTFICPTCKKKHANVKQDEEQTTSKTFPKKQEKT